MGSFSLKVSPDFITKVLTSLMSPHTIYNLKYNTKDTIVYMTKAIFSKNYKYTIGQFTRVQPEAGWDQANIAKFFG
jgi:hypothetical protein